MSEDRGPRIQETIARLYQEAEVPLPDHRRPIAPLAALVGTLSLRCMEIAGLNERIAREALGRDGGPEPPPGLSEEPLAGYLYAAGEVGAIFVRRSDPIQRRRFSVAHELGHYLLHFRPLLVAGTLSEAYDAFPEAQAEPEGDEPLVSGTLTDEAGLASYERREREADLFAAHVLMPEGVVRTLAGAVGRSVPRRDLEWRLAAELLVSPTAMGRRLRSLGLA